MEYLQLILSLIGVLGLFFFAFWFIRRLNKRVSTLGGSRMKILDRVSLGRDSMLFVISVGGRLMLVGSTPQRVEKMCDLEMTEEEYLPDAPEGQMKFSEALKKVLRRENGGNDGEE